MELRALARRFGRELYCHRNVSNSQVTSELVMQQAMRAFDRNKQRALMNWLTKLGPFWEDSQHHNPDDYLDCNGRLVTDTAVGEAAYCCFQKEYRGLVSVTPSSWEFSPVPVTCQVNAGIDWNVDVLNHWRMEQLEVTLKAAPDPITTWQELERTARAQYPNLTFSADSFAPLTGHPFVEAASRRFINLFETLDSLQSCFDEQGHRTPDGHQLYQDRFTGENAWFSDSSVADKNDFQTDLTFQHPELVGQTLFCPFHGKVNAPKFRVHFSWPLRANEPVYVVYVGPKITKA